MPFEEKTMSQVRKPANAVDDSTTVSAAPATPSEDQKVAEMEKVQEEAAVEREEDGGYQ